jgi:hypothetical protein
MSGLRSFDVSTFLRGRLPGMIADLVDMFVS